MWCKICNIETNEVNCPVCGTRTVDDVPIKIYWCSHCKMPVIQFDKQTNKKNCPLCGEKTK